MSLSTFLRSLFGAAPTPEPESEPTRQPRARTAIRVPQSEAERLYHKHVESLAVERTAPPPGTGLRTPCWLVAPNRSSSRRVRVRARLGDGDTSEVQLQRIVLQVKHGRSLRAREVVRAVCERPNCCNPDHLRISNFSAAARRGAAKRTPDLNPSREASVRARLGRSRDRAEEVLPLVDEMLALTGSMRKLSAMYGARFGVGPTSLLGMDKKWRKGHGCQQATAHHVKTLHAEMVAARGRAA